MSPAPIPPTLRAAAPGLARRLGVILAALAALIARAFLHNPARVALIIPLWRHITRTARRFERLATNLAAGRLPRAGRPGRTGARATRLPTRPGWLVADLRHEAVAYASQLAALLAEPAAAELIAAVPAAGRLLNPVCRMLGLPPLVQATPQAPTPPAPEPAPPASEPPTPRHATPPPRMAPPPCPRVRWPWFPPPSARPA